MTSGLVALLIVSLTTFTLGFSAPITPPTPMTLQPAATSPGHQAANPITFDTRYVSLQSAINAACNGTIPGTLILPNGTVTIKAELLIPANCTILGQGSARSVIEASPELISPDMAIQSVSNVILRGLQINGNRRSNPANVDCVDVVNAKNVVLDSVAIVDCNHDGILITGSSSQITVRDSDIANCGPMKADVLGQAAILVGMLFPGSAVSGVTLKGNTIHDSITGFSITNTDKPGLDMTDFTVSGNRIYSNANDGILITTPHMTGGNITHVLIEKNEIYCNGWPANGTEFSPKCTPGLQQKGSIQSQGGVGVDLIQSGSARVVRPTVDGNTIHDNVFEGVAPTTTGDAETMPIVNIAGKTVTWISGPVQFNYLSAGQYVMIGGKIYGIASVTNPKSFNLQVSLGTLVGVSIAIPAYMGAIIRNNTVSDSGNGSRVVGPCFYNQLADGNAYSGNTATRCALGGYENFVSNFLSYNGDKAYSNGKSKIPGHDAGFAASGSYGTSYVGISTGDVSNSPTQTYGVLLSATVAKTSIQSQALSATVPVRDDSGTATLNGAITARHPRSHK
jgi:hypothetical protein